MLSRANRFTHILGDDWALRLTVAGMTCAAGAAYWLNASLLLFGLAVLSPMTLLILSPKQKRRLTQEAQTGLFDSDSLVHYLDESLGTGLKTTPTACIVLRVDDLLDIETEMGASAVALIRHQITDRLLTLLRRGDHIAYLGDNQFAIALTHLRAPELGGVLTLIKRVQQGCEVPVLIDGRSLHITVSAGFCLSESTGITNGAKMVEAAKMALLDASMHAPAGIRAFSAKTPQIVSSQNPSGDEILDALSGGQITAWFQPQVSADTGHVTGFEALARWDHPVRGIIPPSEFLPTLVTSQRMEALSETMLHHSLKAVRTWDKAGVKIPSVSVNFSTQELRNPSLMERIKWDVDRFDLDPSRLTVEILETVVCNSEDDIISRNIRALHAQGFSIDLDDFGTGHASLANIKRFSVDRVKIDRSFITHADDDPDQQRMIAAIVGMAERLGIKTLAEGVETLSEHSILSQLGCTHLQGFSIARPMPFDETIDWIKQHESAISQTHQISRKTG